MRDRVFRTDGRRWWYEAEGVRYYLVNDRASPNYYARWRINGRQRNKSLLTDDLERAKTELILVVAAHGPLRCADPQNRKLAEVILRYLDNQAVNVRRRPIQDRNLRRALEHFGADATVADLMAPGTIDGYTRALQRRGYAKQTVNDYLSSLRTALNYARRSGLVAAVPEIPMLTLAPDEGRREATFEPEEAAAFWDAIEDEYLAAFFMLAANTGARSEALLELQVSQVDLEHRLLFLNPPGREQNDKVRPTVRISAALVPWLEAPPGRYLVMHRGQPLKKIAKAWRSARRRAGLDARFVPTT